MGLVQSAIDNDGTTTRVPTLASNITAGNALVLTVAIAGQDAGATVTPSGGGSGSWVEVRDTQDPADGRRIRLITWIKVASGGGTNSATVTLDTDTAAVAILSEFTPISGILTQPESSDEDVTSVAQTGGGPFLMQTPALTSDRDLLFLYACGGVGSYQNAALGGQTIDTPTLNATPAPAFSEIEAGQDSIDAPTNGATATLSAAWTEVETDYPYGADWTYDHTWTNGVYHATHILGLALIGAASELAGTVLGRGEGFAMLTAPHSSVIPASPIALPERWFFGGVDLQEYGTLYLRASRHSHPPLRGMAQPYTGLEGRQALEGLHDGRTLPFGIVVLPNGPDGDLAEATDLLQAQANVRALQQLLVVKREQQLLYVAPDGTGYVAAATVASVVEQQLDGSPWIVGLDVDFFLADPWFYGLTVAAGPTTISASGQLVTITHPGDVPGDRLILEFVGTFTGLVITNTRNGSRLAYPTAVTSTQRLHLNCRKREARVNGALVNGDISHWAVPGDTSWMRLEPGDNPLEITGSVVGGTMTHSFLPPYV